MQNFKRATAIVFAITLVITAALGSLCGCRKEMETGCFKYVILDKLMIDGVQIGKHVRITGLTKEGTSQRVLIVPKEIKGVKVASLDYKKGMWDETIWESDTLEKVFFHKNYLAPSRLYNGCPNLKSVIIIDYEDSVHRTVSDLWNSRSRQKCYVNPIVYFAADYSHKSNLKPANVTFNYNYEDSVNYGVYWLDSVDCGEKIETIPKNPTRSGHEFKGWYKEVECINEWDFNTDRIAEGLLDENEEVVYQETKLFAKWAEK